MPLIKKKKKNLSLYDQFHSVSANITQEPLANQWRNNAFFPL